MPKINNAFLRYRILNACFTNPKKRYWTITELLDTLRENDLIACKRTLERDFEAMRHDERLGYLAPITYVKAQRGYCYSDPAYTIDALPLTEDDLQALTLASNIVQPYLNVKLVQQFKGVVEKLGHVANHLRQPKNKKLIAYENPRYYKGHEFFDPVLQAITNQQPVSILYRKFGGIQNDAHILHPYFLKEFSGRWYVLGYSEARQDILTLGLDRFLQMEDAAITFRENTTLKPRQYFQHTLGVTLGDGPVEEIELWFSATMAPYVKTQHLHHSQKNLREDSGGLVITLRLILNPELTRLILSYGAEVKVLKPARLKENITRIWHRALVG